jgi:hypothetical protein
MSINTEICMKLKLDGMAEEINKLRKKWKDHVILTVAENSLTL